MVQSRSMRIITASAAGERRADGGIRAEGEIPRGDQLRPDVAARRRHGRHRHQHRQPRGINPRIAERARHGHRDAGARGARHHGQRLRQAHQHGVAEAPVPEAPRRGGPAVRQPQQHAVAQRGPADDGDRAERRVQPADRDGHADRHQRQGRERDAEGEHGLGVVATARGEAQRAPQHRRGVAPEVEDDRGQRADMHGHVDGQALVLPARQRGEQREVAGRTDRQELGDALDHGEDGERQQGHKRAPSRANQGRLAA